MQNASLEAFERSLLESLTDCRIGFYRAESEYRSFECAGIASHGNMNVIRNSWLGVKQNGIIDNECTLHVDVLGDIDREESRIDPNFTNFPIDKITRDVLVAQELQRDFTDGKQTTWIRTRAIALVFDEEQIVFDSWWSGIEEIKIHRGSHAVQAVVTQKDVEPFEENGEINEIRFELTWESLRFARTSSNPMELVELVHAAAHETFTAEDGEAVPYRVFEEISQGGRIAYGMLCAEKYLLTSFPDRDWALVFDRLWGFASGEIYWDDWDYRLIDMKPECLFEFPDYESSDYAEEDDLGGSLSKEEFYRYRNLYEGISDEANTVLEQLETVYGVYAYAGISGVGQDSIDALRNLIGSLASKDILPPNPSVVASTFRSKTWD